MDEKTVPVVTEDQMLDLLTLAAPALARTSAHHFRLVRDQAVLYMLWHTPGRFNEIFKICLEDLDKEAGAVLVMGEGRRERWLPIGGATKSVLVYCPLERERLLPNTNALWVSEQGEAILPSRIFPILKRLGNRAGIPKRHTHRFRHSYAGNALRAGIPERVLQIRGGWKRIPTRISGHWVSRMPWNSTAM